MLRAHRGRAYRVEPDWNVTKANDDRLHADDCGIAAECLRIFNFRLTNRGDSANGAAPRGLVAKCDSCDWSGRDGVAGHAVNPSMGARWRHPWRQRSCPPTPPHLRQVHSAVGNCGFVPRGCWQVSTLVDTSVRYRMSHPRMAWIYCVHQGRHLPKRCKTPFRQIAAICRRRGGSGCGGVSRMGPRHASGGLGRTPNPGLAVCAGQRTRASRG